MNKFNINRKIVSFILVGTLSANFISVESGLNNNSDLRRGFYYTEDVKKIRREIERQFDENFEELDSKVFKKTKSTTSRNGALVHRYL